MDTKISRHAKDIINKYTSSLFRNATLEYYGIKAAKIKELINVELPVVEVAETSTDFIFLLEDDTYLHFEFQTGYKKEDLIRFAMYDLRLYERDKRKIQTVIIYSADVSRADDSLNIGSMVYYPESVMMNKYNGNKIYADLEVKLKAGQELTDIDTLNLIFLPLMQSDTPRKELTEKSIGMAQTIQDKNKRNTCIASVFACSYKYLSESDLKQILEVLKMTDLATMLIEDKVIEIEKKLLKAKVPTEIIAKSTGLDIDIINDIQKQQEIDE